MSSADDSENPYAASSLYEPNVVRPAALLAQPIVARGTIGWPDRRRAFLLAYGVTNRDLVGLAVQALIMVCFGLLAMAAQAWVPLVFMTPLFFVGLFYLGWRRWKALASAREEQHEQGQRWLERVITDEGVSTLHDQQRELTAWQQYALCRLEGDLLVLVRRNPASFQAFPRSHFTTEADWHLFHSALQMYVQEV